MNNAQKAFGSGDFATAADCFDKLIKSGALADPSMGYMNKGVALTQLKKYPEALECFDKVLEKHPGEPQALNNKAQVFAQMKNWKGAVGIQDEILKTDPTKEDAHRLKCNYLNMSKDYEAAVEACDVALKVMPNNLKIHTEQLLAQVNVNKDQTANMGADIQESCDWFEAQGYLQYNEKKTKLVASKKEFPAGSKVFHMNAVATALQQVGTWLNTTSDKKKSHPVLQQINCGEANRCCLLQPGRELQPAEEEKEGPQKFREGGPKGSEYDSMPLHDRDDLSDAEKLLQIYARIRKTA